MCSGETVPICHMYNLSIKERQTERKPKDIFLKVTEPWKIQIADETQLTRGKVETKHRQDTVGKQ